MILLSSFALIYSLVLTSSVESKWIQKSWKEMIPVRGYIQLNDRVFNLPGQGKLNEHVANHPGQKSEEPAPTPIQTPIETPVYSSTSTSTTSTPAPTTSAPTTTTTTTTTTPAPTTPTTTTTRAPSTTTTTTTTTTPAPVPVIIPSTVAPRAPSKTQRKESWREKQERIRFSVVPPPEPKGKSHQVQESLVQRSKTHQETKGSKKH